jgi:hypothetical protein
MICRMFAAAVVLVLAAGVAPADVTLRYSLDIKASPIMPPQALEALKSQMQGYTIYLKGSKALVRIMSFTTISDFDGAMITLLDPKGNRFATVSSAEYMSAVGSLAQAPPEARKVLDAMKFDVSTRATGRSEVVHGIQAEERELVFTIHMALPQFAEGPLRMVYLMWAPRSDEVVRNRALQELSFYTDRAYAGMNPADMMQKAFGQIPGMAEKLRSVMQESRNMRAILRMRGAFYMPGMAAILEKLRQSGRPVPEGVDPNAPMMEFMMDLLEMSTAEISDSVFRIPDDYTPAPFEEVMKSVMPARPAAARQP